MEAPRKLNRPITSNEMPRFGGIATMFRLPHQQDVEGLDACFVGVPFDTGASNRNGTRFGPRKIRAESVLVRVFNQETGADPYNSIQVADIGDVNFSPFDIKSACQSIKQGFDKIIANGCRPIVAGGDHTISYPILQSMKEKYGPIGLIHVDAHTDTYGPLNGFDIWHGNPFRLAVEEGLLDCDKVWQIGLRGSGHSAMDAKWGQERGFKAVPAFQCWNKSLLPLMKDIREKMGDTPVYISFDIDGLDPSVAPGTGTPEIGGLTSMQGLEIVRGCRGLNVVGGDVVEVSPPYDQNGATSVVAANLLFEMLCVLPGVKYTETAFSPAFQI
ncbi:hypothetical protein CAPTEDRAFT_153964 [Capitella teleta]|uniref:Agmatinase n=1 Tax=Capitella teleta TaxID=283909 RepID=R7TUF1_CAPTE|nr:hypothetical protein CAPTEDRAFT_153964 [Capitella teleta]|eukprot:ELT97212.1 hypothetical protein CAPTEDRAFT_153964 [Capitella teleta]